MARGYGIGGIDFPGLATGERVGSDALENLTSFALRGRALDDANIRAIQALAQRRAEAASEQQQNALRTQAYMDAQQQQAQQARTSQLLKLAQLAPDGDSARKIYDMMFPQGNPAEREGFVAFADATTKAQRKADQAAEARGLAPAAQGALPYLPPTAPADIQRAIESGDPLVLLQMAQAGGMERLRREAKAKAAAEAAKNARAATRKAASGGGGKPITPLQENNAQVALFKLHQASVAKWQEPLAQARSALDAQGIVPAAARGKNAPEQRLADAQLVSAVARMQNPTGTMAEGDVWRTLGNIDQSWARAAQGANRVVSGSGILLTEERAFMMKMLNVRIKDVAKQSERTDKFIRARAKAMGWNYEDIIAPESPSETAVPSGESRTIAPQDFWESSGPSPDNPGFPFGPVP